MEPGNEYFICQDTGLSQIIKIIVFTGEKMLNNINVAVWKHIKKENSLLPVVVHGSKTLPAKLSSLLLRHHPGKRI